MPESLLQSPCIYVLSEVAPGDPNGHGITLERVLAQAGHPIYVCCERVPGLQRPVEPSLSVGLLRLPPRCKSVHIVQTWRWLHYRPLAARLERHFQASGFGLVLATPVGYGALFRAGLTAAWRLGLPTAIWALDDFLFNVRERCAYLSESVESFMQCAVSRADALFAISPEMAELFQSRWRRPWEVLVNPVVPLSAPPTHSLHPSPQEPLKIGFFGDVYCAQAQALLPFSVACQDRNIQFIIYGDVERRLQRLGWGASTSFLSRVPAQTAVSLMRECHLLYLPLTFDAHWRWCVTTSFPTKVADYVAAGRPVIVHGPHDSTIVRFARRHNWGFVIETIAPAAIGSGLAHVQANYAQYAANALQALPSILREIGQEVVSARLTNALDRIFSNRLAPGTQSTI